jgi:hypothetical protein
VEVSEEENRNYGRKTKLGELIAEIILELK